MGRSNAEARVSQMDDSELLKPLIVRGPGSEAPRSLRKAGKKREARASTMVSERVYVALQRGGAVRSTLEVEDLMLFVSQVHPLKLFGSFVRRTLSLVGVGLGRSRLWPAPSLAFLAAHRLCHLCVHAPLAPTCGSS